MSPELHDRPSNVSRGRVWMFVILAAVTIALGVLYATFAKRRVPSDASGAPAASTSALPPPADLQQRPQVVFLSAAPATWGRVLVADPGVPAAPRYGTDFVCDRVHVAAGHGVCLTVDDAILGRYRVDLFDGSFRATGESFGDLETFRITNGGERLAAPDFNFWGVTFVGESPRFYATLATGGRTYLIEGNVTTRSAVALRENAECPSVSSGWHQSGVQATTGDLRQSPLAAHRARSADAAGNDARDGIIERRRPGRMAGRGANRVRHPGSIGPCRRLTGPVGRKGRWHRRAAAFSAGRGVAGRGPRL